MRVFHTSMHNGVCRVRGIQSISTLTYEPDILYTETSQNIDYCPTNAIAKVMSL